MNHIASWSKRQKCENGNLIGRLVGREAAQNTITGKKTGMRLRAIRKTSKIGNIYLEMQQVQKKAGGPYFNS